MPKSNYLARAMVNHVFCGPGSQNPQSPFPQPSGLYIALFTTPPSATGGGIEVSGGGYSRQYGSFLPASLNGQSSNSGLITFPVASSDWGTLVSFAIFDAPTVGNMLCFESLLAPIVILTGDSAKFPPGVLTVREL